jgi:hypothetical protein
MTLDLEDEIVEKLKIAVIVGKQYAAGVDGVPEMDCIVTSHLADILRHLHIVSRLPQQANQDRIDGVVVQI